MIFISEFLCNLMVDIVDGNRYSYLVRAESFCQFKEKRKLVREFVSKRMTFIEGVLCNSMVDLITREFVFFYFYAFLVSGK